MIVSGLYNRLESSWGFTLSQVHVGVRVRSGLLNERSSTIPVGRVQALQVSKPMLWRVFDGHRVKVSTAGKGGIDDMEGLRSLVLPVGSPENVAEILELVLPLAEPPTELVRDGLNGIDGDQEYTISPAGLAGWTR
ncbi:PH domain-containing protein [Kocuria atrinae]|uniref:PH domain-containing protein n=1 Tax=Kocuria atrinae TaxID=592377 RepID=UPI001CB94E34|nr:PH domain-containing protein [Kocuria atrinae]